MDPKRIRNSANRRRPSDGLPVAAGVITPMNLRCTFHVSPLTSNQPAKQERPRMPSVVDIEEAQVEEMPRGRSVETWNRARGWGSED